MIHLLPLSRVLAWLSVSYAAIIGIILSIIPGSFIENIAIAMGGSTILHLCLLFFFHYGWKKVWGWFPILERLVFPDLNGTWEITIDWLDSSNKGGIVLGTALIKVDFLKISLVVKSKDSDSVTLSVRPSKHSESGCPTLHYIYRVTPKFKKDDNIPSLEEYNGAAILTLDKDCSDTLTGNYFTDRYTKGHFILKRT